MRKLLEASLLIALLSTTFVFAIYPVKADIDTNDPSYTWGNGINDWTKPSWAYTSNDLRAMGLVIGDLQGYTDYGFSIPSENQIDKVEIGIEGYVNDPSYPISERIYTQIGWNNSATWYWGTWHKINPTAEQMFWFDVTNEITWNPERVNVIGARIKYMTGGGGACYGLDAEVGLWNGTLIKVRDVKEGMYLIGWNQTEIEIENKGRMITELVPTKVLNVTLHEGAYPLIRIIAESSVNSSNHKDVLVTLTHKLPFIEEFEQEDNKTKVKIGIKEAQNFTLGDKILGYVKMQFNETTWETIAPHFLTYHVSSIEYMNTTEGVMDIRTQTKWFMGHYLLAEKEPWTGYVDWLPIRITHSLAPSEAFVIWLGLFFFSGVVLVVFWVGLKKK